MRCQRLLLPALRACRPPPLPAAAARCGRPTPVRPRAALPRPCAAHAGRAARAGSCSPVGFFSPARQPSRQGALPGGCGGASPPIPGPVSRRASHASRAATSMAEPTAFLGGGGWSSGSAAAADGSCQRLNLGRPSATMRQLTPSRRFPDSAARPRADLQRAPCARVRAPSAGRPHCEARPRRGAGGCEPLLCI